MHRMVVMILSPYVKKCIKKFHFILSKPPSSYSICCIVTTKSNKDESKNQHFAKLIHIIRFNFKSKHIIRVRTKHLVNEILQHSMIISNHPSTCVCLLCYIYHLICRKNSACRVNKRMG